MASHGEHERQHDQARKEEQPQQAQATDNPDREVGEQQPADEAAGFMEPLHLADGALELGPRQLAHLGKARNDPRHLLDGAVRDRVPARHHQRGHDGCRAEPRPKQLGEAGALERRRPSFCACHSGDSGRNGRMMMSGMAGTTPEISRYRHGSWPPWTVGRLSAIGDDQIVDSRHEDAADRSEGLRVADDGFAPFRIGKQLREPGDGGDELHADADERAAAPEEQLRAPRWQSRRRRPRRRRGGCSRRGRAAVRAGR